MPIVVRHFDGTSREVDSVERSSRPEERLDAGRMHSLRYCGAMPVRQRYVSTHSRNWIRSGTLILHYIALKSQDHGDVSA